MYLTNVYIAHTQCQRLFQKLFKKLIHSIHLIHLIVLRGSAFFSILPVFREKKLRHREAQELAKGHLKPSYIAPKTTHALARVAQATARA